MVETVTRSRFGRYYCSAGDERIYVWSIKEKAVTKVQSYSGMAEIYDSRLARLTGTKRSILISRRNFANQNEVDRSHLVLFIVAIEYKLQTFSLIRYLRSMLSWNSSFVS